MVAFVAYTKETNKWGFTALGPVGRAMVKVLNRMVQIDIDGLLKFQFSNRHRPTILYNHWINR